ncbi:MAG: hypothetical protein C0487_11210 [Leptothrix sp. (in: Bacteria)]|nr:hypothetical protein [Leptothrix sp. (in: b-proteobacteria)]
MTIALWVLLFLVGAASAAVLLEVRKKNLLVWLKSYLKQDWRASAPEGTTKHLMFCFVDHFEPQWQSPSYETECARVARWRQEYPALCEGRKDADGRSPVHSFFYPEEEYRPEHLNALVDLCRMGLGEIEIHLHHDKDTEQGLREKLQRFTELLIRDHGALPRHPITKQAQWCFIHGNWALDNSHPQGHGHGCGVNNELIVLREEGCYVDYTFPAAPDPCQTSTINNIYYATDDPSRPKSHDTGVRVQVGGQPVGDLMIIQGPLGFMKKSRKFGVLPRIENSDVRTSSPPTKDRVDDWVNTGIHVKGRPEWVFVKVHTHGTQERDMDTLLGAPMREAFKYLETRYNDGRDWKLHYVSAREMYNIVKAAEAGKSGDPVDYRDFVVARPTYVPEAAR